MAESTGCGRAIWSTPALACAVGAVFRQRQPQHLLPASSAAQAAAKAAPCSGAGRASSCALRRAENTSAATAGQSTAASAGEIDADCTRAQRQHRHAPGRHNSNSAARPGCAAAARGAVAPAGGQTGQRVQLRAQPLPRQGPAPGQRCAPAAAFRQRPATRRACSAQRSQRGTPPGRRRPWLGASRSIECAADVLALHHQRQWPQQRAIAHLAVVQHRGARPTSTCAPMSTRPIFITRSSNKCVCGPDQAFSTLPSPMRTQSYSVTSVVSSTTPRPIWQPSRRRSPTAKRRAAQKS